MSDATLIGITFGLYVIAVAALGFVAYRRTHNLSGFLLGDRKLSYWVTALSAGASDMSGWLLLGLPGLAYVSLYESMWVALGLFIGTYSNWRFVARPLREQSERYGQALTIPEFFERRFNDDTHALRTLSALCILVFFVFYTAAGFVAGGKLFAASFGLAYTDAVVVSAVLIVAYTSFGGFLAVAWTDALQATLMFVALVVVASLAFTYNGGENSAPASVSRAATDASWSATIVVSSLAWGLGYFGQPHILARFMAIEHSTELGSARRLATSWTGIALCAAIVVGFSAHSVLAVTLTASDSEKVFMHLINLLLHPAVAGICLAAILAAIMSTADSQLLIAAAAFTHDLVPNISGRRLGPLRWHRLAVAMICVIAMALSLDPDAMVFDMVAYAWAGFGATIGPCVIMSLYARDTSRWSALGGMLTGAVTVAMWEHRAGGIFDTYSLLPGFSAGIVTIVLANRLFCPRDASSK